MFKKFLIAASVLLFFGHALTASAKSVPVSSCQDLFMGRVTLATSSDAETLVATSDFDESVWVKTKSTNGRFQLRDSDGETFVVASAKLIGPEVPFNFVAAGVMLPVEVADSLSAQSNYFKISHDESEVTSDGPVVNGFVSVKSDGTKTVLRSVTTENLGYQIALRSHPYADSKVRESRLTIRFNKDGVITSVIGETSEARGLRDGTVLTSALGGERFELKF